ncbi:ACR3 family arsenite efflux transporter [Candidatus Hecatella orcuttiae]|jgi:ACR3 family arsenite transporter|uniref:ACR3 family arsenite efflux transporter n=1 Tax=Candidatus Hecatella orcuttiae TaxID=1935119 RepID=UPI002867B81D|nr:ACR3 family arsenite efflux transporter [Candidatus Hecatella orcuttiae]
MATKERRLGVWEKYLSVWVVLCIIAGIGLGRLFPQISDVLSKLTVAYVSIPIAVCLFAMIYPIMVQIDFKEVVKAGKTPKPIAATLFANWAVKPFTMAFFAWLFLGVVFAPFLSSELSAQYRAGLILLGVAPCTAMVLVWSYLARGNMGHTLVMTAINSLTMVVLYAPLAVYLLGISGIVVPWETIAFAVTVYIVVPLIAGYITRSQTIKRRGLEWFNLRLAPRLGRASVVALLITLVVLFSLQGYVVVEQPLVIGMIATGIFANILLVFGIAYLLSKVIHLSYEDAAPTAIIAGSNHFEVAIAVATVLFGLASGAALATVVGVLTEVPFMLFLVWLCKSTRSFFHVKVE